MNSGTRVTVAQYAKMHGRSRPTVQRAIDRGDLQARKEPYPGGQGYYYLIDRHTPPPPLGPGGRKPGRLLAGLKLKLKRKVRRAKRAAGKRAKR